LATISFARTIEQRMPSPSSTQSVIKRTVFFCCFA